MTVHELPWIKSVRGKSHHVSRSQLIPETSSLLLWAKFRKGSELLRSDPQPLRANFLDFTATTATRNMKEKMSTWSTAGVCSGCRRIPSSWFGFATRVNQALHPLGLVKRNSPRMDKILTCSAAGYNESLRSTNQHSNASTTFLISRMHGTFQIALSHIVLDPL